MSSGGVRGRSKPCSGTAVRSMASDGDRPVPGNWLAAMLELEARSTADGDALPEASDSEVETAPFWAFPSTASFLAAFLAARIFLTYTRCCSFLVSL